jgi:hypothetical protein
MKTPYPTVIQQACKFVEEIRVVFIVAIEAVAEKRGDSLYFQGEERDL